MAIGGIAVGLVAGASIIFLLTLLNRRFGTEENIVQVCAVLGMVRFAVKIRKYLFTNKNSF
jgi:capsular polysaccharide biosynthesis protein